MPFLLAVLPYLLIEALTFWAVASSIGVGWALFTVFALMVIGMLTAGVEMRRVGRAAARQQISAGRMAGDYGLLTVGAILAGIPGIASSVVGLLLIFPLSRGLVRKYLAVKLVKTVEDLGVRSFEATNAGRAGSDYGSFGGAASSGSAGHTDATIIDEDEINEWTENMRPEDFNNNGSDEREDKK